MTDKLLVFIGIIIATTAILVQYFIFLTKLRIDRALKKKEEIIEKRLQQSETEIKEKESKTKPEKDWLSLCIEDHNYDEAITKVQEEKKSLTGEARLDKEIDLSYIYFMWGKNKEGFSILKDLVTKFPKYTSGYYSLASQYKSRNMNEEATAVLNKGLSIFPHDKGNDKGVDLLLLLSEIYRRDGDRNKIEEMINKIGSLADKTSNIYVELAKLQDYLGKVEDAVDNYKKALEVEPENIDCRYQLALFLYDKNKKIESLIECKKIISLDPQNAGAYGTIGNIYYGFDLKNKALVMYEKAHDINPNLVWIIANIGNLYKSMGLYRKAQEYFDRALKIQPADNYSLERLSSVLKLIEQEEKKENDLFLNKVKE